MSVDIIDTDVAKRVAEAFPFIKEPTKFSFDPDYDSEHLDDLPMTSFTKWFPEMSLHLGKYYYLNKEVYFLVVVKEYSTNTYFQF